jgi:hypothetical protein
MATGWMGTDWTTWAGIVFLTAVSAGIHMLWFLSFSGRAAGIVYAAIAAQLAYIGQVLGVMLVLGWLGILQPLPLIVVNAVLCAAVYAFGVRPCGRTALDRTRAFLVHLRKIRIPVWAVLLGAFALILLLRNLFWGWFLPPFMRDDIAYHLTIMGNILQSGAVRYFPSPSEWIRDYPVNSELFQAWNFIFLGVDKLVDLAFLPTVMAGGLALYGICRRFGLSRRAAVVGWAVYAFTPLVVLQQTGSYNDAWKAALFLCGVYLVLAQGSSSGAVGDRGTAVLAGISAGVILGTKFSGMLDGIAIGSLLLLAMFRGDAAGRHAEKTTRKARLSGWIVPLSIFGLLTLFFGAYPLVRNAIVEGNPLAPVEVKIGDRIVWQGKSASEFPSIGSEEVLQKARNGWERFYLVWFEKFQLVFDPNNSGTGPIWLFLGIPGAVLWTGEAFRKRNGTGAALSILSLMILIFTPAQWRPRYVLSLLLICGLGAAWLVDSIREWPRRIVLALLVLSAAFITVVTLRPSPLEADKAMALVFHSDDLQRNAGRAQPNNEFFEWVEDRTRVSPAVIVYGRWVDTYPLFGADLRNTVISLAAYSAEEWDRQLAASGADLVVTAAGSPEEEWTRGSGGYTEVFRYDSWAVWEKN